MPQSAIIHTQPGESFAGGQLIEDTGVISDLDGGFDTATAVVLFPGKPEIKPGPAHPNYPNMYLFGVSPQRLPGGYHRVTLTYKGVSARSMGGSEIPSLGGDVGKFTHGVALFEKTWAPGELTGTIDGVNASTITVAVTDYRRTVRALWVGTAPVRAPGFNKLTGLSNITAFGFADTSSPYSFLAKPLRNYPYGWVVKDLSADQAAPGTEIYANSITCVETPKWSPA